MRLQKQDSRSGRFVSSSVGFATLRVDRKVAGYPFRQMRTYQQDRASKVALLCAQSRFGVCRAIVTLLRRLDRPFIIADSPFQAVRTLEEAQGQIDTAFLPFERDDPFFATIFFDFLSDKYPSVRRIAYAQRRDSMCMLQPYSESLHELLLWHPFSQADFVRLLRVAQTPR